MKQPVSDSKTSNKTSFKKIKCDLIKEYNFLKNVFTVFHIPLQMKGENDSDLVTLKQAPGTDVKTSRARSIGDLEEKLNKIKAEKSFSIKTKYIKKSLSSKLNKKLKKKQRTVKKEKLESNTELNGVPKKPQENNVNVAKPIFNSDGKLVFSKFDFADLGHKEKPRKFEKDPKKLLDDIKKQKDKVKHLEETMDTDKIKQVKDKLAWKTILKKAEGEKIKDDPVLLKKSIKKMEQKKKQSKKQWDERITNVKQKLDDRQKKRQENISKKKKEKKGKVMKSAIKRGRVVI